MLPSTYRPCLICSLALLALLTLPHPSAADPSAHFELRLAPNQPDAELTLGDAADSTLTIELWLELNDVPPGVLVQTVGVLLRVTNDGIITYNPPYVSTSFSWTAFFPPENTPFSGDVSILCLNPLAQGQDIGLGAPGMLGWFTVSPLALGSTSYTFGHTQSDSEKWTVSLTDGTVIDDADCNDGSCNLTGSLEGPLPVINVVSEPAVPRSPDADDDGDVDVGDYAIIQSCASLPAPLAPWCQRVDLNWDDVVTSDDLVEFTSHMTGAAPAKGDLDNDGDVDLFDVRWYQVCRARFAEPGLETDCRFADIDRNGIIEDADNAALVSLVTGPGH